jgi:hypothetical protein
MLLANEPDALVNVEGLQPRPAQWNLLAGLEPEPAGLRVGPAARARRLLQATRAVDMIGAVAGMATAAQMAHLAHVAHVADSPSNPDDAPAALSALYVLGAALPVASIAMMGRGRSIHRAIASAANLSLVTATSVGLLVWQLREALGRTDSVSEHVGVDATAAVTWVAAAVGTATQIVSTTLQRRSDRIHAQPMGTLVRSQGLQDLAAHATGVAAQAARPPQARHAWDNPADELATARATL